MALVKLDVREAQRTVSRQFANLGDDLINKAGVMALNKTIAKSRTEMSRAIRAEYRIKASAIKTRLRTNRASLKFGKYTAELNASGRPFNVVRFLLKSSLARTRNKSGELKEIRFKIKKKGGVKTIKGAFVATMSSGHTAVFRRQGKGRLPIESIQTIGVPQMFNTRKANARVVARMEQEFPIEFERAASHIVRSLRE